MNYPIGILNNKKAVVAANTVVENLAGESVLLDLESLTYTSLDDVATQMFVALTNSESIESAYQTLLSEYDVEPELLRQDLSSYIEQLLEQGLIEIQEIEEPELSR